MIEQLILSQGISQEKQSGMTARILSEVGFSGLNHSQESVRKVAERILVFVYKVNARLIRKQLPPDDEITRRNLLYRQLFTEFDQIDQQVGLWIDTPSHTSFLYIFRRKTKFYWSERSTKWISPSTSSLELHPKPPTTSLNQCAP